MHGVALLAFLSQASAEAPDRYVLHLAQVPVAAIEAQVVGGALVYRSVQGFVRDGGVVERRIPVDDAGQTPQGLVPEVLLLSRRPAAPGCVAALEELSGRQEQVCVAQVDGGAVQGTIGGQPFSARYERERLEELTVLGVRFVRATTPLAAQAPTLLPAGAPRRAGLPEDARRVTVAGVGEGSDGRCLDVARAAAAADATLTVVLGLVEEDGRLWPHAWVRRGATHLDPTQAAGAAQLAKRRYWALPARTAGQRFLELAARAQGRAP